MSEAVGQDPYIRSRGEIIVERRTVVPPWAETIKDFGIKVQERQGDELVDMGFTLGEVAPECRWAINANSGEMLSNAEFLQKYEAWYAAHYTMRGEKVEGEPLSIPNVKQFVSRRVDPNDESKLVPMDFDPNRPVVSKPKKLYDRDGENPVSPEELKQRKDADDSGAQMKLLVEAHKDGLIDDATFIAMSGRIYGGSVVVSTEGADSSEPVAVEPPPGFEQKPEPVPEPQPEMVTTLCGAEVKKRGKHVHELRCKACAEVRAVDEKPEEVPQEE